MTPASGDLEATRVRLVDIVGKDAVPAADGSAARAVVFPADEQQLSEVAALTTSVRVPVVVWGGGTKQDVQPVQPPEGIVLRTDGLASTAELDAANLTVTVGAGKVLDDLQRELAAERLFLPLDPVDSARATVGGTLATNSSGPGRLLYRTARDMVLGVRVVTPQGEIVRAGGKTVKDVAGYDMKKLYIGSWGTLGAIAEATFRLLPLPETRATVTMVFPHLSSACGTVSALLASFMRPSSAELMYGGATLSPAGDVMEAGAAEYLLMVRVEGAAEDVKRQKRDIAELARGRGASEVTTLQGPDELQLWERRKRVFAGMPADRPAVLVKGSVLLKRVLDYTSGIVGLRELGLRPAFAAHAGNGIVYSMVSAEPGEAGRLVAAVERLQKLAAECGGFALPQKGPAEVVERVQLWPPRSDYGLMRAIKAQMDPNNLWNPARTPGGRL